MRNQNTPTEIALRTYQVGFGDCFLLSFRYPNDMRHVLIDFGSTGRVAKGPSMQAIADDVAKVTGGKLHVVVATHRHADHISGFAGKPGDTIAALSPDAVLQPWTEHPHAARDAKKAPRTRSLRGSQVAALDAMHVVSGAAVEETARLRLRGEVNRQLRFIGEDNLKNVDAVRTLMRMKGRRYLAYGDDPRLDRLLPGIRCHVLGPPTLEQSAKIAKQRARDPEYWHLRARDHAEFWGLQAQAGASTLRGAPALFASRYRAATVPLEVQWFCNRLRTSRGNELLQIVRALDNAMNNTSLILLFEVGRLKLLFPGDAQIENWQYALELAKQKPQLRKLLEQVDVYKVGHHGSLNATPKTLWGLFTKRGPKGRRGRLHTVMSTRPGKHGNPESKTEVPRRALVTALTKESDLVRTDQLPASVTCTLTRFPL